MYKGVTETTGGYEATFYVGGKKTSIGTYDSAIEAALAYDLTAMATFGDFVEGLNFPELTEDEALVALAGNTSGA